MHKIQNTIKLICVLPLIYVLSEINFYFENWFCVWPCVFIFMVISYIYFNRIFADMLALLLIFINFFFTVPSNMFILAIYLYVVFRYKNRLNIFISRFYFHLFHIWYFFFKTFTLKKTIDLIYFFVLAILFYSFKSFILYFILYQLFTFFFGLVFFCFVFILFYFDFIEIIDFKPLIKIKTFFIFFDTNIVFKNSLDLLIFFEVFIGLIFWGLFKSWSLCYNFLKNKNTYKNFKFNYSRILLVKLFGIPGILLKFIEINLKEVIRFSKFESEKRYNNWSLDLGGRIFWASLGEVHTDLIGFYNSLYYRKIKKKGSTLIFNPKPYDFLLMTRVLHRVEIQGIPGWHFQLSAHDVKSGLVNFLIHTKKEGSAFNAMWPRLDRNETLVNYATISPCEFSKTGSYIKDGRVFKVKTPDKIPNRISEDYMSPKELFLKNIKQDNFIKSVEDFNKNDLELLLQKESNCSKELIELKGLLKKYSNKNDIIEKGGHLLTHQVIKKSECVIYTKYDMGVNKDVITESGGLLSDDLNDIFHIDDPITFLEKVYPGFYEQYLYYNDTSQYLEHYQEKSD